MKGKQAGSPRFLEVALDTARPDSGLFLLRQSATALAEERAFPLGIPASVGGLMCLQKRASNSRKVKADNPKKRTNGGDITAEELLVMVFM